MGSRSSAAEGGGKPALQRSRTPSASRRAQEGPSTTHAAYMTYTVHLGGLGARLDASPGAGASRIRFPKEAAKRVEPPEIQNLLPLLETSSHPFRVKQNEPAAVGASDWNFPISRTADARPWGHGRLLRYSSPGPVGNSSIEASETCALGAASRCTSADQRRYLVPSDATLALR